MVTDSVIVSGRNMDIGEALTEHVEARLNTLSEKYFGRLTNCRVAFTKSTKGHSFTCNIQAGVGNDMHYAGEAEFDDIYRCFAIALAHVAKQLRRKKRELHEDKPNGHMKERVLNELSQPDPDQPTTDDVIETRNANL